MKGYLQVIFIFVILFFTGCGIPSEVKEEVNLLVENYDSIIKKVSNSQDRLSDLKKYEEHDAIKNYIENEKINEKYALVKEECVALNKILEDKIIPIKNKNKKKNLKELKNWILLAREKVITIDSTLNEIAEKEKLIAKIVKTMSTLTSYYEKANQEAYSSFAKLKESYLESLKEFPEKEEDLRFMYEKVENDYNEINNLNNKIKVEVDNYKGFKLINVEYVAKLYSDYKKSFESLAENSEILSKKISELYKIYEKILLDVKQEYFVWLVRTRWKNNSDWDSEYNQYFDPIKVDKNTFDYLNEYSGSTLATKRLNFNISIKKDIWDKLEISQNKINTSDGTFLDFWIADISIKTYHKYRILKDKKVEDTDWVEVNPDDFEKKNDSIGIAIESKPYGYFEEDKIHSGFPAEMNYINNSRYGEWKNENGNTFWQWYGKYAFISSIFGGNEKRYYQNDYNNLKKKYNAFYDNKNIGSEQVKKIEKYTFVKKNSRKTEFLGTKQRDFKNSTLNKGSRKSSTSRFTSSNDYNFYFSSTGSRNSGKSARGRGVSAGK